MANTISYIMADFLSNTVSYCLSHTPADTTAHTRFTHAHSFLLIPTDKGSHASSHKLSNMVPIILSDQIPDAVSHHVPNPLANTVADTVAVEVSYNIKTYNVTNRVAHITANIDTIRSADWNSFATTDRVADNSAPNSGEDSNADVPPNRKAHARPDDIANTCHRGAFKKPFVHSDASAYSTANAWAKHVPNSRTYRCADWNTNTWTFVESNCGTYG
jgi:hypothetical protein